MNLAAFTITGALFLAALLLGWRRDRQRKRTETASIRTSIRTNVRIGREWVPPNIVRAWESWN